MKLRAIASPHEEVSPGLQTMQVLTNASGDGCGRKRSDFARPLSLRQTVYVQGVLAGKTKKRAALDAGYALSTAENAAAKIETPHVREVLQDTIWQLIPPELIAQRLREGLDAEKTIFLRFGGKVHERRVIDYAERLKYIVLAAKYGGYYVDGQPVIPPATSNDATDAERLERLLAVLAERAGRETPAHMDGMTGASAPMDDPGRGKTRADGRDS